MPSPFPGMDPYLEDPAHWPNVHHGLISEIQAQLNRLIRPRYVASVEERTYFPDPDDPGLALHVPDVRVEDFVRRGAVRSGGPMIAESVEVTTLYDEDIREARVEIVDTLDKSVVTVIEVLSPGNKIPGSAGRKSFLDKRQDIMRSPIHWVEIDLLRGRSTFDPIVSLQFVPHDYRVHVSPVELRPRGRIWQIQLEQRLPIIGIPLRAPEADVPLDLQNVLDSANDRAAFDAKIDYAGDPKPPLTKAQAAWAKKLLPKRRRKS